MKMLRDSFNFIVIEKQYSLTRVPIKVWGININTLQLHFNTDVNINKHKLWHNKPKVYNYTMTKGMEN